MKSFCAILVVIALFTVANGLGDKEDHFHRHHKRLGMKKHHPKRPQGGVSVHVAESGNVRNETVSIDVIQNKATANGGQTKLKVNLRIHVIEGNVHVNGHKIDHAVITSIHLKTEIDRIFGNGVVKSGPAIVHVRVMVLESTAANGMKQLAIQEEIVQIDKEEVSQITIKEIVLELSDNGNESKRTINIIEISKSKIHSFDKRKDTHVWACRGRLPHKPFHADRKKMDKWRKTHMSHDRPPTYEMGKNKKGRVGDDDDDDNDDNDDNDDKHGKHQHSKGLRSFGHRFCRWFHRQPILTRAVFCISVILLSVLLIASCCICACKKTKKPQTLNQSNKHQLTDVVCADEDASPLPTKKSLDKQPLIA